MDFSSEYNTMSFPDCSKSMSFKIEDTLLAYLDHLKLNSVEDMATFFALLEVDSNTICARKMVEVGGWRCADCVKNDTIIFCQDCWSLMKDMHKDHNIVFLNRVNGTCDCGDHNCIDKKYFCPNHKGIIEGEEEIKKFINKSLGENLSAKIKEITETMFDSMFKYFVKAINEKKIRRQ